MKKFIMISLFAGLIGFLGAAPASAITLSLSPGSANISVGQEAWFDVIVSGLEVAPLDEIVSSFDFDLTYDDSVLSATGVTFGLDLGDPVFFEAFESAIFSAGLVDFGSLSVLPDFALQTLQGDSVILASVHFQGIASGHSALDFSFAGANEARGLNAQLLSFDTISGASVDVAAVPEPGMMLLMGAGLIGLAFWKKRPSAASLRELS